MDSTTSTRKTTRAKSATKTRAPRVARKRSEKKVASVTATPVEVAPVETKPVETAPVEDRAVAPAPVEAAPSAVDDGELIPIAPHPPAGVDDSDSAALAAAAPRARHRAVDALGWLSVGLGLSQLVAPRLAGRFLGANPSATARTRLHGLRDLLTGLAVLRASAT